MFHWLGWDQWIEISWEWNYLLFHLNSCWKNQFSLTSVTELVGFCLKWCCIYIFDVIVVIMVDHFSHQLGLEEQTIWLHVCSVNSCTRYFELYNWIFDMHLINLIFSIFYFLLNMVYFVAISALNRKMYFLLTRLGLYQWMNQK